MQCLYILQVIEAIANAIASTEGCNLLDVDPGASTNRTVYTFVGTPEAIVEGALNGARVAYQAIDMTRHKGSLREREREGGSTQKIEFEREKQAALYGESMRYKESKEREKKNKRREK